jgi:glycosyltransferase involved in cell wall biosynthesis
VVSGPDGWRASQALRHANARVVRLPWLPAPELASLVRSARALVFPSLAEGFGLPVLEAMTLGAPVVTSNRGALAEVAGDAALLVDPEDVEALAQAILRISHDDALRARLSQAGLSRAGAFSEQRYAERLARIYRQTLEDLKFNL